MSEDRIAMLLSLGMLVLAHTCLAMHVLARMI